MCSMSKKGDCWDKGMERHAAFQARTGRRAGPEGGLAREVPFRPRRAVLPKTPPCLATSHNAPVESFFATLKKELVAESVFQTSRGAASRDPLGARRPNCTFLRSWSSGTTASAATQSWATSALPSLRSTPLQP